MTISTNIKCDVCGHTFTLKSQMDDSINLYNWPIAIVCPDCNNHLNLSMTSKGILPANFVCSETQGSTHVAYSATLPVCREIYYQHYPTLITPFSSSFLNLYNLFGQKAVVDFGTSVRKILNGIIPHRHALKELYPLLIKKNVETFSKKLSIVFNNKIETTNKNLDCVVIYFELIKTIYNGLQTDAYEQQKTGYFKEITNFIQNSSPDTLNNIISATNTFQNIDDWLEQKAFNYIANITAHLETYIPALFYSSIGNFVMPHTENLNILTIDYNQANDDYAIGFEILIKIIPLIIALHNTMRNGDCNIYRENGNETNNALSQLTNTFGGKRKEIVENYPNLKEYFEYTLDNHIRNGENHCEVNYDVITQTLSYKYNINNPNLTHTERLIDLCFRVYLQFMRIIEIITLIIAIKKRIHN